MKRTILKLQSNPNSILQLEAFVQRIVSNSRLSDEQFPNILISLTEAVNNAIIHGNNNDENKYVNICTHSKRNKIVFIITDEGEGFNPDVLEDPTQPERIECCGGRGVFLMQQLSDGIEFIDKGRTVKMQFVLGE